MQQSQPPDLMQDYSLEYSKMLLLPYQQQPVSTYEAPMGPGQPMHYQQQQEVMQQVMQPTQMLLAPTHGAAPSQQQQQQQHAFSRLQQHPEQLHLQPSNQSLVHKTKHTFSHNLNRCHAHHVARQPPTSSPPCCQAGARVRQLNSYLDDQQHLASLHQPPALSADTTSPSYGAAELPELAGLPYSLGRPRLASVSAQQPHISACLIPNHLNNVAVEGPTGGALGAPQSQLARATSAPQPHHPNTYYGLSPKSSSTPGVAGSVSPNEALSLGINLEQYISKRNERERSRVKNVNDAFDNLKCSLPLDSDKVSKRISKVEILRTAISYIRNLESMLAEQPAAAGGGADASQHHQLGPKRSPEEAGLQQLHTPTNHSPAGQASTTPPETSPTGTQIYLARQQAEQQHATLLGSNDFKQVQAQHLAPQQDYLDLMNSLEFEDMKLDY